MTEYFLQFGTERKEVSGSSREVAYENLPTIYQNCSTPEDLVEVGEVRQPASDGLTDFLKQHQSQVDDS